MPFLGATNKKATPTMVRLHKETSWENEQISGIFKETLCCIGDIGRSICFFDNETYQIFV